MQLFSPDVHGSFLSRPNRFIVIADTPKGQVRAHCPNPGRMRELLFPGTPLILERSRSKGRKTAYSLVAAKHRGVIVPLHSTRTNLVAEKLVLPLMCPDTGAISGEVTYKGSRFDFAYQENGGTVLVEVKSCTLCENGIAMFPDAPTARGVKHLTEMEELVMAGTYRGEKFRGGKVIFVIGHPGPDRFVANLHTDPVFAATLARVSEHLDIHACAVEVSTAGTVRLTNPSVPVCHGPAELVERNCGVYLMLLKIGGTTDIETGALGVIRFRPGWYVYAGSAKKYLTSRIGRHMRKRKKMRWHIDYLSAIASDYVDLPVYTNLDLECELAKGVRKAGGQEITGFGASDCSCTSHLFWFEEDPLNSRDFADLVFSYRHKVGLADYCLPPSTLII